MADITDDMIETLDQRIAEAVKDERLAAIEASGGLPPTEIKLAFEAGVELAHEVARELLAGRVVLDLPEPDERNDGVAVWVFNQFDVEARGDTVWFAWHDGQNRRGRNLGASLIRRLAGSLLAALAENARTAGVSGGEAATLARRWPVGSPEPKEPGLRVKSIQNGVIFRYEFARWCAESGSGGDGRYYDWHQMNSEHAAEGGMELVEVSGGVGGDARHG